MSLADTAYGKQNSINAWTLLSIELSEVQNKSRNPNSEQEHNFCWKQNIFNAYFSLCAF